MAASARPVLVPGRAGRRDSGRWRASWRRASAAQSAAESMRAWHGESSPKLCARLSAKAGSLRARRASARHRGSTSGRVVQQRVEQPASLSRMAWCRALYFSPHLGAHASSVAAICARRDGVLRIARSGQALDGKQHHVAVELALEFAAQVDVFALGHRCRGGTRTAPVRVDRALVQHRQVGGDEARAELGLQQCARASGRTCAGAAARRG